MRLFPILALLLPLPLAAQTTLVVPATPNTTTTTIPLSQGIGHYQQWWRGTEFSGVLTEPMRFEQVRFLAGGANAVTTTIDCEVMIGHGALTGLTGSFGLNFTDTPLIVHPRSNLTLVPGGAGAGILTVPFQQMFTWDGENAVVIDIKVYGNGQGNQPFPQTNFLSTQFGFNTAYLYTGGNANATGGTVRPSQGMLVEFSARPGVVLSYNRGCAGANFVTPVASVSQVPWPGITWVHTLSQASGQRLCALIMGDSDTMWGSDPLPLDLGPLLNANGCLLLTNPLAAIWTQTVGSPGSAIATLQLPLPPITDYIGFTLYSQWLVLDPSASNGFMSGSQGLRSIVAPVGG